MTAVWLVVVAVVGGLVACTPKPAGPESAAQAFFAAFAEQDFAVAAAHTDRPGDAESALAETWDGLQAESLTAGTTGVQIHGDAATVTYSYEWHLPKDRI